MHAHDSLPSPHRETIDLWVSDFLDRPAAREPAARMGEDAGPVLAAFLEGACHGGKAPADVEAEDASHALLDHCSTLELDDDQRRAVPTLVAAFLADLEDQGRLAGGRAMSSLVRAAGDAFQRRAAGRGEDLTRPSAKIGRNDPCPCGSGKKYKKCCMSG